MSHRLHFQITGREAACPVVLLHGLGLTGDLWWPQLPAIERIHRVINVDLPGHGRSPLPRLGSTMSNFAADIAELIAVQAPVGAHIAGISTGAMLAQMLAIEHPRRVLSLALCNTTSAIPETAPLGEDPALYISRQLVLGAAARARSEGMRAIAPIALKRWFRPAFHERDPVSLHRVEAMILTNPPEGYARVCEALAGFHATDRLATITVPTLIIAGSHDPGTPLACSEVIAGRIRHGQLVVMPDSAHITNVERPAEFTAALVDFLQTAANLTA